jgi:hypothetical protein
VDIIENLLGKVYPMMKKMIIPSIKIWNQKVFAQTTKVHPTGIKWLVEPRAELDP